MEAGTATVGSSAPVESKQEAGPRVEVLEVESPTILARQAIGVFDSGSGGMVAAAYLSRILRDAGEKLSVVFFGDTANLPYGKKTEQEVALLSDSIIGRLAPSCPVIGIACNTASASWMHFGKAGKAGEWPRVFSVVQIAAELAYERARTVPEPKLKRRRKTIGVLGTELTAQIQSHAERIVECHRTALSRAYGHQLPLVPYAMGPSGPVPQLPESVIDYARTPHIAVLREDEPGPGGTTRAGVMNWEPPEDLPHGVEIVARDAQKLVAAVDVEHILDAEGNVKPEWRERLEGYLHQVSSEMVRRRATALILGCTHFEYFTQDFGELLPTLEARNGIISPSGALACRLLDAFDEYVDANPVRPISSESRSYFAFSGDRPPQETFKALGLEQVVLAKHL
jgi:glutamate racemase